MKGTRVAFAVKNTEETVLVGYWVFVLTFDYQWGLTRVESARLQIGSAAMADHLCLRCQWYSGIHLSCQIFWHICRKLLTHGQYK
jgi:hypothetical protein